MKNRVLSISVNGLFTDGNTYHENLLPKYLQANGNEVYILASEYALNTQGGVEKIGECEYVDENGIRVKRLKIRGDKSISYKFKRFKDFYRSIEEINPDIIFCHLFQFLDVGMVVKYKKEHPEVKVFFDSHADEINSAHTLLSRWILHKLIWRFYAKKAYSVAERFYGVSPARVDFLLNMYKLPGEKVQLLTMGVDDELVLLAKQEGAMSETRSQYGIMKDDFVIVTGGKIDEAKWQVLNLMQVVQKMDVKLFVFGSVSEGIKGKFMELAKDNVHYVGWLDEKEAYKLFAIANLVVFPATHSVYWEQVCGQGIPMIVRRWHGFEHLDLEGNLLYLEDDTIEELVNKMNMVFEPGQYQSMLEVAENKGMETFSYKELAKKSIE